MTRKLPPDLLELLHRVALFSGLDDRDLTLVDRLVDQVDVSPGRVLVREGSLSRQSFIVLSGRADVTVAGMHVATIEEGDVVGGASMMALQPETSTVIARTPLSLLVMTPRAFESLLAMPVVARKLMHRVAERLRAAEAPAA